MKFSLILATLNRDNIIKQFLDSLVNQDYKNFELIVIDQNNDDKTKNIISNYTDKFEIKYVKVDFTGVAKARNEGIQYTTGDIIAFPDDDCAYETNVLSLMNQLFEKNTQLALAVGASYIFNSNKFSIGSNSKKSGNLSTLNIYGIEFTKFFNKNIIDKKYLHFDITFGVGAKYKSTEGIELAYKLLKLGYKGFYSPDIKFYHELKGEHSTNYKRVYDYSIGIGAFIRKYTNRFDIDMVYYIIRKMLLAPLAKIIIYALLFKRHKLKYACYNICGIWHGFLIYKENSKND